MDSQLYKELGYVQQKTYELGASETTRIEIDPSLFLPASDRCTPQEISPPPTNEVATPEPQGLSSVLADALQANKKFVGGEVDNLNLADKWIKALNDPKLSNDPIMKYYKELNNHPRGRLRKYLGFMNHSDLPDHLKILSEGSDGLRLDSTDTGLTSLQIRELFDFAPGVRARFCRYFKRRDGYVKLNYQHLLDEVDPVTGDFRLPTLQICSLDPKMLTHYIRRHYPELAISNRLSSSRASLDSTDE